jgi:hypothetical protein
VLATSVTDVILGEAGGRTEAERYQDMLAIASVIVNRSQQGGVPPEKIVSAKGQFDAYGRTLPAGTGQLRSMAERAWQQVLREGPVHNATYFSTPKTSGNLPRGLKAEMQTGSHVYRSDPEGRAFLTADGYVRPAPSLPAQPPVPTPADRTGIASAPREIVPGAGLANLAPNGLTGAPTQYQLGPGRSAPASEVEPIVDAAIKSVMGPDWTARVSSGTYTPEQWDAIQRGERDRTGSTRHDYGRAQDFAVVNVKTGETLQRGTHDAQLQDIGREAAARGIRGLGFSAGYMDDDGTTRFHMDIARPGVWGRDGAGSAADAEMKAAFLDAKATGVGALPNTYSPRGIPTPTSRETGIAMPSVPAPSTNFAGGMSPRRAQEESEVMRQLGLPDKAPSALEALGAIIAPPAAAAELDPNAALVTPFAPQAPIPGRAGKQEFSPAPPVRSVTPPAVPTVPAAPRSPDRPDNRNYGGPKGAAPALPPVNVSLPATAPVPTARPDPNAVLAAPGLSKGKQAGKAVPDMPAQPPSRGQRAGQTMEKIGKALPGTPIGFALQKIGALVEQRNRAPTKQSGKASAQGFFESLFGAPPKAERFSVGTGLDAIMSVLGGAAPGATAQSASHPGASWSVNNHDIPEFTSQHGFTGPVPDGF